MRNFFLLINVQQGICISKIIQIIIMLADLEKVEKHFYNNETIQQFLSKHSIHEIIKLLNKSTKSETRTRIKTFFYKLNESNCYKDYLVEGINQAPQNKAQFLKYITSEFCEEYYELLQKKTSDVVALLQNNISLAPMIFSLIYSPSCGIKMIKVFNQIYSKHRHHNCLYSEQIRTELNKGLESQDSVVAMRFVQIVANIAIHGGKSFEFVKDILEKSLNLYETEDILLKLNIVQIIAVLGLGAETSQLLRGHKIWSKVQKDALDPEQQFYVRKSLLILLVDMMTHEQYQQTPKFTKSIIQFLDTSFKNQGQNLQAGLQLTTHLFRSNDGAKILVQNSQFFGLFLKMSRSPQDRIKNLFVQALTVLTDKTTGKKTKQMVMNILNCVGNPNLSNEFSHNVNSNNFMTGGIDGFSKWFIGLLQLPFEDLEIKILHFFVNLLEYNQICQQLFENQNTTKYILRPVGKGNTVKVLRSQKNRFVQSLFQKGSKQWKNTKLEQYAVMIEKQLQKEKMEMEIQMEAS